MMKAHGIHQSQTAAADAMRMTPTPSRQKPSTAPTSGKKRKKDQTQDTDMNEDDDEVLPNIKGEGPNSGVKTEASCKKIKAEWPEEGVRNKRIKAEDVKEESKGKGYETKIVKEEKQDMEDASARTQTEVSDLHSGLIHLLHYRFHICQRIYFYRADSMLPRQNPISELLSLSRASTTRC